MNNTVPTAVNPSTVRPSGGIVQSYTATLPAMPAQPHPVEAPPRTLTEITLEALEGTGANAADIHLVRTMIAAGQVYTYASKAAHNGGDDEEMTAFFSCLDTVVEHIIDGRPLKPLIAAAEKVDAKNAAAEPGHYPWCAPGQCITAYYDDGESYVEHHGAEALLPVPSGMPIDEAYLLKARLCADEALIVEGPYLSYTSGGNGLPLTAAEVDDAIDSLTGFVEGLRTMRRQMNAAKAARS
ncbi:MULTISPECIES: DUF6907 domain-containing protein [unclassified Streptomyces]|uniref:DUF6907 domain-containing protein n=1 Tax=unclassified Streptomyces TaxID=2593676 RepID=UPI00380E613C